MKNLILSITLIFIVLSISNAQSYDVRFNRTSANCNTLQVCYDVQLRPVGAAAFNLAGQNYRIFYNSALASYISGTSSLPSQYGNFTLVQDLQNVDASTTDGPLSFEADLGFLNYGIDLNDTQSGGIVLPAGQWTTTSNLCFIVAQEVVDNPNTCLEKVWGRDGLTNDYATAFVEVSRWLSNNNTTNAIPNQYIDLNSTSGDAACLNEACAISTISVTNITVNENAGSATVQVCLAQVSSQPVTVKLNTSNGSALSGSDYVAISNATVTIPAGQLCTPVSIPLTDDSIAEGNETFNVTLSSPSPNAIIGNATAIVTITDNESVPVLSVNSITVNENANTVSLTATLSGPSSQNVTFSVNTQNGTAMVISDYTAILNQTFTIPAGQTSVTINIPVIDDLIVEPTETFNVVLSNPSSNATIGVGTGIVTILDNDVVVILPSVSVSNVSVNENAGSVNVQVCQSAVTTQPVSVTLNTSNGSALAGIDYVAISNATITIPAGQLCMSVSILIINDNVYEGNENFGVTIASPSSNAILGNPNAVVTIIDNETIPTISINNINVNENDGTAALTVTLSVAASQNVTFTVNTQNGTASAPSDFTAKTNQTYTIPAGQTSVVVNTVIINDAVAEVNETFNVVLSSPSANAVIGSGTGVVTILDNDIACAAQAPVIIGN